MHNGCSPRRGKSEDNTELSGCASIDKQTYPLPLSTAIVCLSAAFRLGGVLCVSGVARCLSCLYNAQSSLHKGVRVLNLRRLGFTAHSPTAEF